jgi:DNA-binding response OmpR family regulator
MAKKVLVVEDDSNIAELLRLYLEKDGFDVFLAADGGEGIRRAQELQPVYLRLSQAERERLAKGLPLTAE